MTEAKERTFKKGEFVIDGSGSLVRLEEDAQAGGPRHIQFIQSRTLTSSGFHSGGYCFGGIWKDGYPKAPVLPDDVLFAAAALLQDKAYWLDRLVKDVRNDVKALERARKLLNEPPAARKEDAAEQGAAG